LLSQRSRRSRTATSLASAARRPAERGRDSRAILEALADEARRILDEDVVASAAEIDACLILGAGYPFFRGGITRHLDETGVSTRVSGRPLAVA
jgi:3-hydroxyacyl-CoA dehydrogenase